MGAEVSKPVDNRPPPPSFDPKIAGEFLDFSRIMLGDKYSYTYRRSFFENQMALITEGDIGTGNTRTIWDKYDATRMVLVTFQIKANKYIDFYNYYADLLDLYRPDDHYESYRRKEKDLYDIGKKFYDFGLTLWKEVQGGDDALVNQFIRIVSYVMTNTDYDYSREWFDIADFTRVYGPEWEWEDAIIQEDEGLPGPKGAIKKKR